MNRYIEAQDKRYLQSNGWKCSKSPSGRHYWIADGIGTQAIFKCKYCGEMKRFSEDGDVERLPPLVLNCPQERGCSNMKEAAIYCRVSSDSQEREGTSLQSQLDACKKLAEERGYSVEPQHIIQEVYSGLTLERPDLTKLRAWLGAGEINAVVIYSSDRFSRDGYDFLTLIKDCQKANVELLCVTEPIEGGQVGELLSYVRGWASNLEAEKIKERCMRGIRERVKAGLLPSGRRARLYGYNYQDGKRHINSTQARWVKEMFKWLVEEGLTLNGITYRLRTMGAPTPSGGDYWIRSTVYHILTNISYTGRTFCYTHIHKETGKHYKENRKSKKTSIAIKPYSEGVEIKGVTPAIISEDLFNQAQTILKKNRDRASRNGKVKYLLSNLIDCAHCGRKYWGYSRWANGQPDKSNQRYYYCMGRRSIITPNKCDNRGYRADELEAKIWEQVEAVLYQPETVLVGLKLQQEGLGRQDLLENELEIINSQLTNRDKQRDRIHRSFYITGDEARFKQDIADLNNEVKTLEERQMELGAQISTSQQVETDIDSIKRACELVRENLKTLDYETKRQALDALHIRVTIDGDNVLLSGAVPMGDIESTLPCLSERNITQAFPFCVGVK